MVPLGAAARSAERARALTAARQVAPTPPGRLSRRRLLQALLGLSVLRLAAFDGSGAPSVWFSRRQASPVGAEAPSTVAGPQTVQAAAPALETRIALRRLPPIRLFIPAIALDSPIVDLGVRYDQRGQLVWETAAFVVGHYVNTANPGELGNCVLSGHISSRSAGAVFRRLPEVQVGSGVTVATADSVFLYQVDEIRVVEPRATEVMDPGGEPRVTLITCVPDGVYTHRLVVVGRLV